jgi:hypothetical protein
MMTKEYRPGVFYPPKINVWPHEKVTAETLAEDGYYVEFMRASTREGEHSADCCLNGELWELKAPNGKKISLVEKNLRKAKRQSSKIVFDSHRTKNLPDKAIERELRTQINHIKGVDQIKFIDKHRKIVDIMKNI